MWFAGYFKPEAAMANWILLLELMLLAAASMETVTRTLERLSVPQSPVMRMQM